MQCTLLAVSAVSVCAHLPRSASNRQGPDVGRVTSRAAEPFECVKLQAVGCVWQACCVLCEVSWLTVAAVAAAVTLQLPAAWQLLHEATLHGWQRGWCAAEQDAKAHWLCCWLVFG